MLVNQETPSRGRWLSRLAWLACAAFVLVQACGEEHQDLLVVSAMPGSGLGSITRLEIQSSNGKKGDVPGGLPIQFGIYFPSGTASVTVTVTAYDGDCAIGQGEIIVSPTGGTMSADLIINPIEPDCGGSGGASGGGGNPSTGGQPQTGGRGGTGVGGGPGQGGSVGAGGAIGSGGSGGTGNAGGPPVGGKGGMGNAGGAPMGGNAGGGGVAGGGGATGGRGGSAGGGGSSGGAGGQSSCSRTQQNCGNGSYCDGACGVATGTCVPISMVCSTIYKPVCGCDNVTYNNDCARIANKIGKKHEGACDLCTNVVCSGTNECCPSTGLCYSPLCLSCCPVAAVAGGS